MRVSFWKTKSVLLFITSYLLLSLNFLLVESAFAQFEHSNSSLIIYSDESKIKINLPNDTYEWKHIDTMGNAASGLTHTFKSDHQSFTLSVAYFKFPSGSCVDLETCHKNKFAEIKRCINILKYPVSPSNIVSKKYNHYMITPVSVQGKNYFLGASRVIDNHYLSITVMTNEESSKDPINDFLNLITLTDPHAKNN